MSVWKTCLATVAVVGGFASLGRAQGVVPGGWAPQFGYQSFTFGGPGAVGGGVVFGTGMPGFVGNPQGFVQGNGVSPFGPSVNGGYYAGSRNFFSPAMPLTVNGVDPLVGAIRRSVRPRRR